MCDQCSESVRGKLAPSRRSALLLTAAALGTAFAGRAFAKEHKAPPKPQNVLSPDAALKRLMDGNARYVEGVTRRHDFRHEREALAGGQNPFAAVLSCADSRIAPEYAFDTGRGDLFVCRVAGNFAGTETIASMEYAVAVLNTPLILVLGHDACGAVDATLKAIKDDKPPPGHIPSLVDALAPAAKAAMQQGGNVLDKAIRQNVIDTVAKLKSAAPILNAAAEQGKLKIAGGIYRLTTGTVDMIAQG
ncbi:carbonic anhydrase [Bradyrhizobium sp. CCBAU 53338]|uniref:carbonic anhydrase n=1 Tax=Bradyrhizobium sp. CCBAU 53338 TaxID=1325111 RepID=UPI00188C3707|nr:carbonic anhydrase [Bradyrhizobium sp. CCBAU 53338]QOZ56205.1 carbonic anhydrase [Bradyrhizobium sp. CCBAU 53338]